MNEQVMILEDGSELRLIHFLYRSPKGLLRAVGEPLPNVPKAEDTYKIACTPRLAELSAQPTGRAYPWRRSEEPRAVTCPNCKATREWQDAVANIEKVLGIKVKRG